MRKRGRHPGRSGLDMANAQGDKRGLDACRSVAFGGFRRHRVTAGTGPVSFRRKRHHRRHAAARHAEQRIASAISDSPRTAKSLPKRQNSEEHATDRIGKWNRYYARIGLGNEVGAVVPLELSGRIFCTQYRVGGTRSAVFEPQRHRVATPLTGSIPGLLTGS